MERDFFLFMLKKPFIHPFLPVLLLVAFSCWLLAFTSCAPNANMQGRGSDAMQGEWKQVPEALNNQLVTYTLYNFKFTCDSFFVAMQTHSRVNYGTDTCMNKGQWTEYVKGRYQQTKDTVWMRGFFCNPNYSLKNPGGCFRSGVYEAYFKVENVADTLLRLTPTSSVLPVTLHLVKRTNCVPKPL